MLTRLLEVELYARYAESRMLTHVQEVEYVKAEAKILYLLHCLQKTAPPVLIFAENKKDVDDIQVSGR